jgi:hypothetical protein
MITQKVSDKGYVEYHIGESSDYWIEMSLIDGPAVLYHNCASGRDCDILLEEETRTRECYQCGRVDIPDDLWTLYVLLDGRGVT